MKYFNLLLLVFLVSCSSGSLQRKIDDPDWDSLADESYLRWGEKRLKQFSGQEPRVVGCYQGETKETLQRFKKDYLKLHQDPFYWLHIGNCFFSQKDWTKAEFYYRMTLEETKEKTVKSIALNNLGLIYLRYEQWERGKQHFREAINLAPKFKVPRFNLSQLYLQFGQMDKAIETLQHPVFRDDKDIDVFFSLANAHLFKSDLKTAGEYFRVLPEESFRREDIAATYALYLLKLGKIKEAKTIMDDRERSGVLEVTSISHKIEKLLAQRLKEE